MKRPGTAGRATEWSRLVDGALAVLVAVLIVALPQPEAHAQAASTASAQGAAGGQTDRKLSPDQHARLQKLSEELRCLVCQNQTLADSQAGLALDLRRQVEDLMAQGKSDDQIKDYLVQRYGDFVLYRPQVKSETYVLWFGPFALLLIGGIAWFVVQRRSSRQAPPSGQPEAMGEQERDRARRLLDS